MAPLIFSDTADKPLGKQYLEDETPSTIDTSSSKVIMPHSLKRGEKYGFLRYLALLLTAAGLPCVLVIVLWSSVGIGEDSLDLLKKGSVLKWPLFGVAGLVMFGLYLADFFWPPHLPHRYLVLANNDRNLGRWILGTAITCLILGGIFFAGTYPIVPLVLLVLCCPALVMGVRGCTHPEDVHNKFGFNNASEISFDERLGVIRSVIYAEKDSMLFYCAAATAHAVVGAACVVVWIIFVVTYSGKFKGVNATEQELMFYVSPLLAGVSNIFFLLFVIVRIKLARLADDYDSDLVEIIHEGGNDLSRDLCSESILGEYLKDGGILNEFKQLPMDKQVDLAQEHARHMLILSALMKAVGCCLLLMIGAAYVAAQLVTTNGHIATLTLCFLAIFGSTFISLIIVWFRRRMCHMQEWLQHLPLWGMMVSMASNDFVRALALTAILPYAPVFLVVSALNQFVRRRRKLYKVIPPIQAVKDGSTDTRQDNILTARLVAAVEVLKSWDWLSMIMKIYLWGFVLIGYVLSPRLLNVLLAWLISILQGFQFWLIIVCTFVAGLCCFLLPPVPGVPVYLFGGFVIAAACHTGNGRDLAPGAPDGFWIGATIAVVISFFLKLAACAMQQKLIGERLGYSITIRQQVGVHQPFFRAIHAVLREKGYTVGKVSVLCGGPDWPTSVLAGLLRLPLIDMELGTVPIIFYIVPCVLSGAFYVRKSESKFWESAADLMVASTLFINLALWVGAAWAIQTQLEENHFQLSKPLLENVDLDWLDYRNDRIQQACIIRLPDVPSWIVGAFVTGAVIVVVVGHLVYWLPTYFFNRFQVNDDIKLLNWLGSSGLFQYTGLAAVCAAITASGGWLILDVWARRKKREPQAREAEQLAKEEEAWKEQRRAEAQSVARVSRATLAHVRSSQRLSQRPSTAQPYKVGLLTGGPTDTEPASSPCAV